VQEEGEESVDCDVGGPGDSTISKLAAMDSSRSSSDRGGSPPLSGLWMASRGSNDCCGWAGSLLVLNSGGAAVETAGAVSLPVLPTLPDLEWMWPKGARGAVEGPHPFISWRRP